MSHRPKLNWSVPEQEWERFLEFVREKHDETSGYVGREAERAMKEYAEADGYAAVEDQIDRLVMAAGRSGRGTRKNKNNLDVGEDGPSATVRCRVSQETKDAFRSHAGETDLRLGVAFAHALQVYREGGRADRLERKLERIVDDAEDLLKTQNDDSDGGLSKKERNTVTICREIHRMKGTEPGEPVNLVGEGEIETAIQSEAGDSEYYLDTYKPLVIDRLNLARDPDRPKLYVPEHKVDPTPAIDTEDYSRLSADQRVQGLCVELGRMAQRNDGVRLLASGNIRRYIFDDKPTQDTVKKYMRKAGETFSGFGVSSKSGTTYLKCKLRNVEDDELLEYIENGQPSVSQNQMTFRARSRSD